jgi:acetoacetate decarboxylase
MKAIDVPQRAYSMPLHSPSYPPGPYRFIDREYLIITYRTDPAALERVVPKPLEIVDPVVKYEFIRMPDSTGFGDYTESGQVIPVRFRGEMGGYAHAMFLDDDPPIAGGRELWGFPARCGSRPAAWATSTRRSSPGACSTLWASPVSCSRSCLTSTGRREFASWFGTISAIST